MARAVEAKDRYTHGHAERVTAYALQLVTAAGLPSYIRELTAHAGPLRDVGKIGVPDHVLSKPGLGIRSPLDDERPPSKSSVSELDETFSSNSR